MKILRILLIFIFMLFLPISLCWGHLHWKSFDKTLNWIFYGRYEGSEIIEMEEKYERWAWK